MQFGLSNGIHDDGKRPHGVERANSDVQRHPLTLQGSFIVWGCVANCLEAFANLDLQDGCLASGFPGLWPRLPSHIGSSFNTASDSDDHHAVVLQSPHSSKDHPVMINPSTYSEDAWKQWHSLSRSFVRTRGVALLGRSRLFANDVGQTLSFGGPDADLSPEGFPPSGWVNLFWVRMAGVFKRPSMKHAPSMARRLMRACCRPMLMADRPSCASGRALGLIERGGRVALASSPQAKSRTGFRAFPVGLGNKVRWSTGRSSLRSQAARSKRRMHWGRWRRPRWAARFDLLAAVNIRTDANRKDV